MTDICFDLCTCGSVVVSDATAVAELKADNERLRAALEKIVNVKPYYGAEADEMLSIARAALGGDND